MDELPEAVEDKEEDIDDFIEKELILNKDDKCNIQNLTIKSDLHNVDGIQLGNNDYELDL